MIADKMTFLRYISTLAFETLAKIQVKTGCLNIFRIDEDFYLILQPIR